MNKSINYLKINSAERDTSLFGNTSSQFQITFNKQLNSSYRLRQFIGWNSFYNVNSTNNTIYYNETGAQIATLSQGYYNSTNIASNVASAMNSKGGYTYSASVNPINNILSITGSSSFNFGFSNTTNSIAKLIGFPNSNSISGTYQTGTYPVNLNPVLALHITVNNSASIQTKSNFTTFVIPITVDSTNFVYYYPPEGESQIISFSTPTNSLQITVQDELNNTLNLNNFEFYLLLEPLDSSTKQDFPQGSNKYF